MFKKFSPDDFHGSTQLKSSVQRAVRSKIAKQFPLLAMKKDDDSDSDSEEENLLPIDVLLPKKSELRLGKLENYALVVLVETTKPLFFQTSKDGPYFPTLRVVHRFPKITLPKLRVDSGAIKHVMQGSNVMCPGLKWDKGEGEEEVVIEEGMPVAVYCEGKKHAVAVGITKMSTEQMRKENKGVGIEVFHHLNDGLWRYLSKVAK